MILEKIFTPTIRVEKIEDLDYKGLLDKGYKAIILDVDNTLIPSKTPVPDKRCFKVIEELKKAGFIVIISSNNTKKRVGKFCKDFGVKWYYWSFKPLPFIYKRILKDFNLKREEVITCGDQLLTDILGSNQAKIDSILVKPLKLSDDQFNTKISRMIEGFLFKHVVK